MFEAKPFPGIVRPTPRPTGTEPTYRYQTRRQLARDQRLWDMAEQARTATAEMRDSGYDADLVTRIRLEYLATADGTVARWYRSQNQIIADYLDREARLRR
jgi:hypothetical protein